MLHFTPMLEKQGLFMIHYALFEFGNQWEARICVMNIYWTG